MLYLDFCKNDGEWAANEYGGRENLEAVEFIKHMNSIVSKRLPGTMMIAEESTSWKGVTKSADDNGLGFTMKWNMGWMNDFLFYIKKDPIYRKYHHNNLTFGMAYNYSENFVLVLSHDEVVHEKSAMIGKMPGDLWQKYANLRLSYGFMYGHPGKKLLFMGGEFAQFNEWSESRSLDWHLLQYKDHQQMQLYMKDLNHFYLSESPFWQQDYDPHGFTWIECDDAESSVVSFIRRSQDKELYSSATSHRKHMKISALVCLLREHTKKSSTVTRKNTAAAAWSTKKAAVSEKMPWNHYQNSIRVKVPPLGMVVLERKVPEEAKAEKKPAKKTEKKKA